MKGAFLTLLAVMAGWLMGAPASSPSSAVTTNGVTVELLFPAPGSVVSNTITLQAEASSLAGPIQRVEFYVDGVLYKTVTNRFASPKNLFVY